MFAEIDASIAKKQAEFKEKHKNSTPPILEEEVFHAREKYIEHSSEPLDGIPYYDSLLKYQINYVILLEIYCDKLEDKTKKLQALQQLESSYNVLRDILIQARFQQLRQAPFSSQELRRKKITEELDMQKAEPQDKEAQDFIYFMNIFKDKHRYISLQAVNYSLDYYEDVQPTLINQIKEIQSRLSELPKEIESLKEQQKMQKPLTRLEKWGLDTAFNRAHPLKQLFVWLYNLGTRESLEEKAEQRYRDLARTDAEIRSKEESIQKLQLESKLIGGEISAAEQKIAQAHRRLKEIEPSKIIMDEVAAHSAPYQHNNN